MFELFCLEIKDQQDLNLNIVLGTRMKILLLEILTLWTKDILDQAFQTIFWDTSDHLPECRKPIINNQALLGYIKTY